MHPCTYGKPYMLPIKKQEKLKTYLKVPLIPPCSPTYRKVSNKLRLIPGAFIPVHCLVLQRLRAKVAASRLLSRQVALRFCVGAAHVVKETSKTPMAPAALALGQFWMRYHVHTLRSLPCQLALDTCALGGGSSSG